jgi:hypothetical protein
MGGRWGRGDEMVDIENGGHELHFLGYNGLGMLMLWLKSS